MALLEIKNISRRFGGLQAVKDVSFTVQQNCIKAVIGPNGAAIAKNILPFIECNCSHLDLNLNFRNNPQLKPKP